MDEITRKTADLSLSGFGLHHRKIYKKMCQKPDFSYRKPLFSIHNFSNP
jgi:hypothetical protein